MVIWSFISLFLLGAVGALVIVYLATQQPIPEFRSLYNIDDKQQEADAHRAHLEETQKEIDTVQAKLQSEELSSGLRDQLHTVLKSSEKEMTHEIARLEALERDIMRSQLFSRVMGFLLYIILGGVFGALLSGRVTVNGLSGDLPMYFESILIGATWTTYLSAIGFNIKEQKNKQNAVANVDALNNKFADNLEKLKNTLVPLIEKVALAEQASPVQQPVLAPKMAYVINQAIESTNNGLQKDISLTKQAIQKNHKLI